MTVINKTEILRRRGWDRRVIKKLIGEPEKINYSNSGAIRSYEYSIQKVEEAENTDYFRNIIKNMDNDIERMDQREYEFRETLETAIRMDISGLDVPLEGSLEEVYKHCRGQFTCYDSIMRIADPEFTFQMEPYKYPDPKDFLYELIANSRQDLAFACGIKHCERTFGSW